MSTSAWQRASLTMFILDVLAAAPRHGYGISQALVAAGLQPVKGAQLSPTLVRLEDEGAIAAHWEETESGPARKVYELTASGCSQGAALRGEWQAFLEAAQAVGRVDPGRAGGAEEGARTGAGRS